MKEFQGKFEGESREVYAQREPPDGKVRKYDSNPFAVLVCFGPALTPKYVS